MGEAGVSTKQWFVPPNGCSGSYTPRLHVAGIAQSNGDSRRCCGCTVADGRAGRVRLFDPRQQTYPTISIS